MVSYLGEKWLNGCGDCCKRHQSMNYCAQYIVKAWGIFL